MTATGFVVAADGTRISYETYGHGPGLIIVPGNSRTARNYDKLARHLSDAFTVHVMERRGRGASGPQGDSYRMQHEVDDLSSLLAATGADQVFGHSYGGLVALECARSGSTIRRLAVFEPGASISGSLPLAWLPRFRRELERGRLATALAVQFQGLQLLPLPLPLPLLRLLTSVLLASGTDGRDLMDLMRTTAPEMDQIAKLDSDGTPYGTVRSRTLLLGGTKSPGYLREALPVLGENIPEARVEIIAGLGHNAPDDDAPHAIATCLLAFYGEPKRRLVDVRRAGDLPE